MNGQPAQQVSVPDTANMPQESSGAGALKKILNMLLFVLVLVVGLVLGFGGGYLTFSEKSSAEDLKEKLPVPFEILTSPVHKQWWISSEGTIISKNSDSIVLEKDGKQATFVVLDSARFFSDDADPETGALKPISLDDIPIGAQLQGGSVVAVTSTGTQLIVQSFTLVTKK